MFCGVDGLLLVLVCGFGLTAAQPGIEYNVRDANIE